MWRWTQTLSMTRGQVRFTSGSTRQGMTLWGRFHLPRFVYCQFVQVWPELSSSSWGNTKNQSTKQLDGLGGRHRLEERLQQRHQRCNQGEVSWAFSDSLCKIWCCIPGVPGFQHPRVQLSQKNIAHLMAHAITQGNFVIEFKIWHCSWRDSNFGRTGTPFQRILLPEYARGSLDLPRRSSVDNTQLPSARSISNALSAGSDKADTDNTVLVMQVTKRKQDYQRKV